MTDRNKIPATPGRPPGRAADEVRGALLAAAREHFLDKEFRAVSVRQIAATAGVNGAMVNYYFGSKQGLYLAMVDELLKALENDMAQMREQGQLGVVDFIRSYSRLLFDNPWWPNFLIREVMFSEGEIREAVLQRFATVFAPELLANINREIRAGHYRADLDPRLTLVSLMGMTVFPFLASPVIREVMQMELDESLLEQLTRHSAQLFLHGVESTPQTEG